MRSISRRFHNLREKNPLFGAVPIFFLSIEGQKFSRESIRRWFNKLVPRKDYDPSDKKALLKWLRETSQKDPEEHQK